MKMIHVPVHRNRLKGWSENRARTKLDRYDPGYALHMLLSAMFGKSILQPFRLLQSSHQSTATLYGYTRQDPEHLRDLAKTVAGPDDLTILDPDQMLWKQMPDRFKRGQMLGFDIRTKPIERVEATKRTQSGQRHSTFTERDYFPMYGQHREQCNGNGNGNGSAGNGTPRTRESDYTCWLDHKLSTAAEVVTCRLAAFYRGTAYRGRNRTVVGPDATLQGTLRIADPDEFRKKLEQGVGRHKAYGYGMMLLRPPDNPPMAAV